MERMIKTKAVSGILSVFIIGLLVLAGPADACIINISVKDSGANLKEFGVSINSNSGENPNVKELGIKIDNNEACNFNIDGSFKNPDTCKNFGIISIEKIIAPDKPGNGPKYGYGYENSENKRLAYKITFNSGNLSSGKHILTFLFKRGNGNKYFVETKEFNIGNKEDNKEDNHTNKTEKDNNDRHINETHVNDKNNKTETEEEDDDKTNNATHVDDKNNKTEKDENKKNKNQDDNLNSENKKEKDENNKATEEKDNKGKKQNNQVQNNNNKQSENKASETNNKGKGKK